jgi:hypothetical protein
MAIEVEQKGTADVLSDVFSAGVTLLELWVGSIGPTFDEYEGVDEVGPEGMFRLIYVRCLTTQTEPDLLTGAMCMFSAHVR